MGKRGEMLSQLGNTFQPRAQTKPKSRPLRRSDLIATLLIWTGKTTREANPSSARGLWWPRPPSPQSSCARPQKAEPRFRESARTRGVARAVRFPPRSLGVQVSSSMVPAHGSGGSPPSPRRRCRCPSPPSSDPATSTLAR